MEPDKFLGYEWDDRKAEWNLARHGVSFAKAASVFDDPLALDMEDEDHSVDEDRFLKLGETVAGELLVVAYTQRGDNVRIISARYATPRERRNYAEGT